MPTETVSLDFGLDAELNIAVLTEKKETTRHYKIGKLTIDLIRDLHQVCDDTPSELAQVFDLPIEAIERILDWKNEPEQLATA